MCGAWGGHSVRPPGWHGSKGGGCLYSSVRNMLRRVSRHLPALDPMYTPMSYGASILLAPLPAVRYAGIRLCAECPQCVPVLTELMCWNFASTAACCVLCWHSQNMLPLVPQHLPALVYEDHVIAQLMRCADAQPAAAAAAAPPQQQHQSTVYSRSSISLC